jgi:hypothetical protein
LGDGDRTKKYEQRGSADLVHGRPNSVSEFA